MGIKIITDSASDLPRDVVKEYDIDVLPLSVIEGEIEYRDNVDILPEELFIRMRKGAKFTTSQVTTNDYYNLFEKYIKADIPCIYIGFSSELSGSYQSSVLALDQLRDVYGKEVPVYIYDTKCASLGFGLIVYKAAQMAKEGKKADEILEMIEYNSTHMEHVFTVFDLEYLHRGGRLKKSAAIVGNILNLYPILDVVDGNLHLVETVRGKKKHFKRIMDLLEERGTNLDEQTIGIVYGDNVAVVEELKSAFKEKFNVNSFLVRTVGAVIGAHTGPEMFSIFFINNNK